MLGSFFAPFHFRHVTDRAGASRRSRPSPPRRTEPATQDEAATQDERLAQADTQAPSDQQIVITGSRIPRANFDTPSPRSCSAAEQIEQRGYTNLGDALDELPAFGVPGNTRSATARAAPSVRARISSISSASATSDPDPGQRPPLRELEHRFDLRPQAGGPGSQVDFNIIPTLLVDRVETIAVGGAPIYGSDAIAGTVNVILKRDFDGIKLDAQYGISEHGDAPRLSGRAAWPAPISPAAAAMSSSRRNITRPTASIYNARTDRRLNSFFTDAGRSRLALRPDASSRTGGLPSLSEFGIPLVTDFIVLSPEPGRRPSSAAFRPGITRRPAAIRWPSTRNGNLVPIDFGDGDRQPASTSTAATASSCPDNLRDRRRERYHRHALAQYQVTDNIRLFGEAWYANSKGTTCATSRLQYRPVRGGRRARDGNFIIEHRQSVPVAAGARRSSSSNLDHRARSATAQDYFYLGRANTDIISGGASTEIEIYRFVGGVDGDFQAFGREHELRGGRQLRPVRDPGPRAVPRPAEFRECAQRRARRQRQYRLRARRQ